MTGDAINARDIAALKAEQLESDILRHKAYISRMQLAYNAIMWLHADLMIQTRCRESIRQVLAEQYAFELPADAHVDLRAMLNEQYEERARVNRVATDHDAES